MDDSAFQFFGTSAFGSELREDRPRGSDRVGGFEDRATDDDVSGSGVGGFGGSHDARLVIGFGVAWADAGCDKSDIGAERGPQRCDFERRADEAAQARVGGEFAEAHDLFFGRIDRSGFSETSRAHRRENRDAEQQEIRFVLLLGFDGPLHHLASATGVQREHANGKLGAGLDGLGDGVGNIVELEVEKDIETQIGDLTDGVRAASGEHLQSDFDPADGALELAESRRDVPGRLGVENEDQVARHFGTTNEH